MQVGHGTAGAVKGKSDPITIYELLGTKGALEHCRQVVSAYETAFSAYAAGKFERALAVLQENASDPPSTVLIERCKASCKCRLPRIGAESTYRRRSKIGERMRSPLHRGNTCFGSTPIGNRAYAARLKNGATPLGETQAGLPSGVRRMDGRRAPWALHLHRYAH